MPRTELGNNTGRSTGSGPPQLPGTAGQAPQAQQPQGNIQPTYGDWRDYSAQGAGNFTQNAGQDAYSQVFRLLAKLEAAGTSALNPDLSVNAQDKELAGQAFDSTLGMFNSRLQSGAADIARAISGQFAERGMSGSTMEAASAGIAGRGLQDQLAQILNQTRGEQANALMQQPMERARTNALLFNSLTQAAIPALNWRQSQLMVGVPNGGKPTTGQYIGQALGGATQIASAYAGRPSGGGG